MTGVPAPVSKADVSCTPTRLLFGTEEERGLKLLLLDEGSALCFWFLLRAAFAWDVSSTGASGAYAAQRSPEAAWFVTLRPRLRIAGASSPPRARLAQCILPWQGRLNPGGSWRPGPVWVRKFP
jgi:hypothetical protein